MTAIFSKKCNECHKSYPPDFKICPDDGAALATELDQTVIMKKDKLVINDRYEVESELGRGGMGVIYSARDRQAAPDLKSADKPTKVAIKLLLADTSGDPSMVTRFNQEAVAAGSLDHPNIVKILEHSVTADGLPYIVMEFLAGQSLSEAIADEAMDEERLVRLMIDIANALSHAHNRLVVHRDIKPSNIMLVPEADGQMKAVLVDFGIAKIFAQPGQTMLKLTQTGEIFGSPLYMSPEQCMGQKPDLRSDIYSLACVIYECLTKKTLFYGENYLAVISQHIKTEPDLSSEKAISPNLRRILSRALSKDREKRQQSMSEIRQELETHLTTLHREDTSGESEDFKDQEELHAHYMKLALEGDAQAQVDLAWQFRFGDGCQQNEYEAFKWFLKAATAGIHTAQSTVGFAYTEGLGTDIDLEKAFYWYLKSAQGGYVPAMGITMSLYMCGTGVEEDLEQAKYWGTKAAEHEDSETQFDLGRAYQCGFFGDVDLDLSFYWYLRAANAGHIRAKQEVGECYQLGFGADKDEYRAFQYYLEAAEEGLAASQREVGLYYFFGRHVIEDVDKAKHYMHQAYQNGDAWACYWMGYWTRAGSCGLAEDAKQSVKYFREGAEMDNVGCMEAIGEAYLEGKGVVRDEKTAAHWLKKAAEGGWSSAKIQLARCYKNGIGVERDRQKALELLLDAATNHADPDAMQELIRHYQAEDNLSEAAKWTEELAKNGAPEPDQA